jgi:hypothetical protein
MSESATVRCPSLETLVDFARGLLAEANVFRVSAQIDRCHDCETRLRARLDAAADARCRRAQANPRGAGPFERLVPEDGRGQPDSVAVHGR